MADVSAHDVVAHCIVEGWATLPYDKLMDLSPTDRLYQSLLTAHSRKEERADARTALVCAVLHNSLTQGKRLEPKDFMPQKQKTVAEQEAEIRANLLAYNAAHQKAHGG